MASPKKDIRPEMRPAMTPDVREQQMIALAINLAEEQLRNGTASSQVITHYLKLGSSRERLEKELREKQKELMDAKTQAIQSAKRMEELYEKAVTAFTQYRGSDDSEFEDDEMLF